MSRLRKVDRFYVRAQQIAFPHAAKIVAGPFEERSEQWAEYHRLNAEKAFPGCNLTVVTKRVPLAECHPKEAV